MTNVKKEDQAEFEQLCKSFKSAFNDSAELKKWGDRRFGVKATHKIEALQKELEKEQLKKVNL